MLANIIDEIVQSRRIKYSWKNGLILEAVMMILEAGKPEWRQIKIAFFVLRKSAAISPKTDANLKPCPLRP